MAAFDRARRRPRRRWRGIASTRERFGNEAGPSLGTSCVQRHRGVAFAELDWNAISCANCNRIGSSAVLDVGANSGQYARGSARREFAARISRSSHMPGPFAVLLAAPHGPVIGNAGAVRWAMSMNHLDQRRRQQGASSSSRRC